MAMIGWLTVRRLLPLAAAVWFVALWLVPPSVAVGAQTHVPAHETTMFQTSHNCLACHNGLTTASGEDVSIGTAWRASMMANSSRDPYWQASVRRETIDHRSATSEIEDECSTCHMPMARTAAAADKRHGRVFGHLPIGPRDSEESRLAADGVSCTLCHQIGNARLGTRESFTGGFVVNAPPISGGRTMFGPFEVDRGRTALMRSATGATPGEAAHIRQSELCATCHTLFTTALDPKGQVSGELPEQMPYLEWRHSAFREERSCQSCHMPEVEQPTAITSVLGQPREGFSRHAFLGGNFFMLRMLNRYRADLGVTALSQELDAAAHATVRQLQSDTGRVAVTHMDRVGGTLTVDVAVLNLTGHKLPTGYPSRRSWLHLVVSDHAGSAVFQSGAIMPNGAIDGNDGDADASGYEPHYKEIRRADQVQIYESVMRDASGRVTTGLLQGIAFLKDNRLLPRGFDKATAEPEIAVRGGALDDENFSQEGDRVRYVVDVGGAVGPFSVEVELLYQSISFRWAQNLRPYASEETRRFVSYYDSMSEGSAIVVARTTARESSE
jgi:hypothetical protein